jgi:steroid delta-isomerase-like uncharacterized protein
MAPRNDEQLRRWFTEIWNQGDIDAADRQLAPTGILHETAVGGDGIQSAADFKAMARVLRRAIPDIHFHVEATIQDDDHAAGRVTVTGTHTGPGLGIAPTGRSFRITGIVMIRVSDGRTVEGWSSFDMLGLFEQLGALKRPDIGADAV